MLLTTLSAAAPHAATAGAAPPASSSNSSRAADGAGVLVLILSIMQGIFGFLLGIAAAKLSYDRFASVGWAILAFFFSEFYIVYYSFFINKPFTGAGRRK
jgi:hypothetical protein